MLSGLSSGLTIYFSRHGKCMAKKRERLVAVSPEELLFQGQPKEVRELQAQAKALRRGKQREEFANRMIAGPDTLGNR